MRDEKGTEKGIVFSTLLQSSIAPAIEAVARVLMIVRPEEKGMKTAVSILMESIDFDISRIGHAIDKELWKDKRDMTRIQKLEKQKNLLQEISKEIDDKLSEEIASSLLGLMESLQKVESILGDEEAPHMGDQIRRRS